MRILIVDDDYVARSKLKALLSKYGDCDSASTGTLAIELFKQAHQEKLPYQLVTMDIQLGDQRGQAVNAAIRKFEEDSGIEPQKQTKILMVTIKKEIKEVVLSYAQGCEEYLAKPFTSESIAAAMKELGFNPS